MKLCGNKRGTKGGQEATKANACSGRGAGELPSEQWGEPFCVKLLPQGKSCTWRQGLEDRETQAVGRRGNSAHVKGHQLHPRSVQGCHLWKVTPRREKGRPMGALPKAPSSHGSKTVQERSLFSWPLPAPGSVTASIHVSLPPATVLGQSLAPEQKTAVGNLRSQAAASPRCSAELHSLLRTTSLDARRFFRAPGLFPALDLLP